MPVRSFCELNEVSFFAWISSIRDPDSTHEQKEYWEQLLFQSLIPFAEAVVDGYHKARNYDAEQVVNDAIYKLIVSYIRNDEFRIHSCGHLLNMLRQIAINERRLAYRRETRAKRVPYDSFGQRLSIMPIASVTCDCMSNGNDPARICENRDEIDALLARLSNSNQSELFLLLLEGYTRDEIAAKLQVDIKTVRLWIDQIRRVLTPHTSHLTPQAPSTKHQAPSTKHQVRSMHPIIFRGINDQGYHTNSLLQRG